MGSSKIQTALLIPDVHIDSEDERALKLLIKIAKQIKTLKEIIVMGDFGTLNSVSRWGQRPDKYTILSNEIKHINAWLDVFDKEFSSNKYKKKFIEGNHCYRAERYIISKAPELFGMIRIQDLLRLKQRKWEFVPYGPNQRTFVLNSKCIARHEPIGRSASTTARSAGPNVRAVFYAHNHNLDQAVQGHLDGSVTESYCTGFLGDEKHLEFSYAKIKNWQKGFRLVHFNEKKEHFVETIKISKNYEAIAQGRLFKG